MDDIHSRIKEARESRKMTLDDLAEKIDYSKGAIAHWESGKNTPKAKSLAKIAEALNVSPVWLQFGDIEAGQVNNHFGNGHQLNILHGDGNKVGQSEEPYIKPLPILDINQAIDYALNYDEYQYLQNQTERAGTLVPHSSYTFAIKMPDDSMISEDRSAIFKDEILIVEPRIKARHSDIVFVSLGDKEDRRGIVAKLEIDIISNSRTLRQFSNPSRVIPMPAGAYICGVVLEVKSRLVSAATAELRVKSEMWNPNDSLERGGGG